MLLPEGERLSTLRQLAVTKAAVEKDLCRLPFTVETPSQIRHKTSLENRLTEVEEAVKVRRTLSLRGVAKSQPRWALIAP